MLELQIGEFSMAGLQAQGFAILMLSVALFKAMPKEGTSQHTKASLHCRHMGFSWSVQYTRTPGTCAT